MSLVQNRLARYFNPLFKHYLGYGYVKVLLKGLYLVTLALIYRIRNFVNYRWQLNLTWGNNRLPYTDPLFIISLWRGWPGLRCRKHPSGSITPKEINGFEQSIWNVYRTRLMTWWSWTTVRRSSTYGWGRRSHSKWQKSWAIMIYLCEGRNFQSCFCFSPRMPSQDILQKWEKEVN